MRNRAFVAAALLAAISAGAGENPCALKKALIAPRLDATFMDDFFKGNVPARGYLFGRRP